MTTERGRWLVETSGDNRSRLLRRLARAERLRLRADWLYWARDEQLPPDWDWRVWLVCAGRGFGKTRSGAEWINALARAHGNARIALVGASIGEARAVMVEGESGVLACSPEKHRPHFEASLRRLTWPGGAQAYLYSAAEPESLRGPQHSHACSVSAGWTGAMIYAHKSGALEPLGATGRNRSVTGILAVPLEPGEPSLISRSAVCEVDLASADFALLNTSIEGLVAGTNRAAIGREIVQFLRAERISETRWRLSGLLRGRGGTEAEAAQIQLAGASFVLLPEGVAYLDAAGLGDATQLAAVGLADTSPVSAPILGAGRTLVPLAPVHPRSSRSASGDLHLNWVRRARGAWGWRDLVDVPLNEETERYTVGLGNPDQPALQWTVSEPRLTIPSAAIATMLAENTGQNLWVRQIGSRAASAPVLLHTL